MIRSSGWDILNKYYHDTLPPHFGTSKTKTSTKSRQVSISSGIASAKLLFMCRKPVKRLEIRDV